MLSSECDGIAEVQLCDHAYKKAYQVQLGGRAVCSTTPLYTRHFKLWVNESKHTEREPISVVWM